MIVTTQFKIWVCLLCAPLLVCSGCASARRYSAVAGPASAHALSRHGTKRILVKQASQHVDADNVRTAASRATAIAQESGGYVESCSSHKDESASINMRVPTEQLESILDRLAKLGTETSRYISAEDVTEEVIDIEATLKNKIALRDRLRKLLDRAENVKDVLAVEQQLTRLQSEIDSMKGRLKNLKGKAKLASLNLYINRKRILGPLGYLGKGLWWSVTKLFIIR